MESELWFSLREAQAMEHTEARTALLEDTVGRADRADVPRLMYLSRRLLADAYRVDGRWEQVYRLLRECLEGYDRRPARFAPADEIDLLHWYAWLVECMVDFPDYSIDDIREAQHAVEHRFTTAGLDWHEIYAGRRGVAAHFGDWAVADRAYFQWRATAPTDQDDRWLHVTGIDHFLARGDDESLARAHALAAPMLADPTVSDDSLVQVRCLMLLPLARAGAWYEATMAYRRLRRGMEGEFHSLEQHGLVIEFCALTGNAAAGVDWLASMRGFEERQRPFATMEYATAVAVLADALVREGRGDTALDLGADDPNSVPFHVVARRMRRLALDLADRFDRRNGDSRQSDRVRARLAASPLTDFLPLGPTSRPALPMLPSPGLSDEALLDRAHWHDLRCEPDEARACLTGLSDDLPEHLDARLVELRAKFFQSADTEPALRRAAEVHRRYGDERRALLNQCWLGLWIAHDGRTEEGVMVTADAVARLRDLGDDSDCAWGEHWLAHVLIGQGRHAEALEALSRGRQHASAAGDLLALGTLLILEGVIRPSAATARAALETLIAAGVPEKALEAVEQLRNLDAHEPVLDRLLADPPRNADRLLGHLRYLRACALIDAGRVADAVDDLNEAIGQAAQRGGDTAEQWYQLVHAAHAAGRHEDAVDAGLRAANRLDHLRDTEDAAWADSADRARYLVADSYRRLGDYRAALREYRRLADGHGALSASAFLAGTALLEELGFSEWPI
ncbi:hypothetical protein ALI22I_45090 [Saccharothrix sp. ALI-22-I]|uniref:hypothetical protein n=1 Tax=Saccharothrix sp. ALI-22-I TaxID=1933778 RepID=UPI00097BDD87|nr:hypothetical protein [Saccharothrix sp. ALI-22-I]ONI80483.1 hypothetical protein ALI22I_45090 [Saccharothrix sp. ALI-22-I]